MERRCHGNNFLASLLIFLVFLSPFSGIIVFEDELTLSQEIRNKSSILIGDSKIVEVSGHPNPSSDDFLINIPKNNALDSLEFDLEPLVYTPPLGYNNHQWESQNDWSSFVTTPDNVDYNKTGLRINSPPPNWDFEQSTHGWSLDAAGGWAWGVDSVGAHAGSKAIYTYLGQYPNQMATTYYATSPSIDCSSCSGGWSVNFWKLLGVESSSWDHAYFQVKGLNGWTTIWQNSGSVIDSSYSYQSYRVDSYISGNSDFRIRFGLGPTDFSVTYDGWNIDDVSVTPVSGSGTGVAKVDGSGHANWTSGPIGHKFGVHVNKEGPYGLLNILAEIPDNSGLDWTVLDCSNTFTPILGYEGRIELFADLGGIDWVKHPCIKIKIHLWSQSPTSPIINSISLGGKWIDNFNQNPLDNGWVGNINWIQGTIEGNGNLEFPKIHSIKPIISMDLNIDISGFGQLQMSTNNETWYNLSKIDIIDLEKPTKVVYLRWISNSGSWSFGNLDISFGTGFFPLLPVIDIRNDMRNEWNLRCETGYWGSQDVWDDCTRSKSILLSGGAPQYTDFWIPKNEINEMCMDLIPESGEIIDLDVEIRLGTSIIYNKEIVSNLGTYNLCLTESQINSINENISLSSIVWGAEGQNFVQGKLKLTGSSQRIIIAALDISYNPVVEFREYYDTNIINTINDLSSISNIVNGYYEIPITIKSNYESRLLVTLVDQHSTPGLITKETSIYNNSEPLVSSEKWIELESKHSVSIGSIKSINYEFNSKNHYFSLDFPIDGSPYLAIGDYDLIEFNEHSFQYLEDNENISKFKFKIKPLWDDDTNLEIKVRLVRDDRVKSIPEIIKIGTNGHKSVENDVEIKSWSVLNDLGDLIPIDMPYLKSGSDIVIEVNVGFEELSSSEHFPKSGDLEIIVMENEFEIARSSNFTDGKVSFVRSIPFGPGNLTYEIKLNPLSSQLDVTDIVTNRTFTADSLAPQLISSTIERYDHRHPSKNQILAFDIFDRPVLPNVLKINLWREWVDDINQDGQPSLEEYWSNTMFSPANLSSSIGRYSYVLDDSEAPVGGLVYGYISGSDSAGNMLVGGGGGTLGDELFVYQVKSDGSPQVLTGDVSWNNSGTMWLNPDIEYELNLPFNEPNGISDIEYVIFDLAEFTNSDGMRIIWNSSESRCESNGNILIILSCNIYSRNSFFGPFNEQLEFRINFKIKWSYLIDESYVHEPSIEIIDRAGYSSIMTLPQLRWRFSNQIWIDSNDLELSTDIGSKIENNLYVLPDNLIGIRGSFSFSRTGNQVFTPINVEIGIGFNKLVNMTDGGYFYFELSTPSLPGNYPLSINLIDLNKEVFDSNEMLKTWIIVDSQAPKIEQISSPRPDISLSREEIENLVIEFRVKETIKLIPESIVVHWSVNKITETPENYLISGIIENFDFEDPIAGSHSISVLLQLNELINGLPIDENLVFNIWIGGSDASGNIISDDGNDVSSPLESWIILPYQPILVISDITYSKYGGISIGDPVKVIVTVENQGNADALTNLTVLVKTSNREYIISREPITVEINSKSSVALDWAPDETGIQWIEVRWNDEYLGEGSLVSVSEPDTSLFSSVGGSNSIFAGIFILIIIVISLLFILNGGDDEYFEEYYEEEDEIIIPEKKTELPKLPPLPPPPKINQIVKNTESVVTSVPVKINSVKQWTDEKGYTWRIEGNNPAKWWDGNSWKDV